MTRNWRGAGGEYVIPREQHGHKGSRVHEEANMAEPSAGLGSRAPGPYQADSQSQEFDFILSALGVTGDARGSSEMGS